jgi:hypothetical protein
MDCQFRLVRIDAPSTYWVDCENKENLREQVETALRNYGWARKYINKVCFRLDTRDEPIVVTMPINWEVEIERIKKLLFGI